jgi:hypothetical protein
VVLTGGSSRGQNGMEIFRVWGYGGSEESISLKSNRNR